MRRRVGSRADYRHALRRAGVSILAILCSVIFIIIVKSTLNH